MSRLSTPSAKVDDFVWQRGRVAVGPRSLSGARGFILFSQDAPQGQTWNRVFLWLYWRVS